jgi:hypothetical protein
VRRDRRLATPRAGELTLTAVALPWLLLPAVLLLAGSQIHPVFNGRYVAFSVPALALLLAAWLSWLAKVAARSPLATINTTLAWLPSILIIVLIGALLSGPQRTVRWRVHWTVLSLYAKIAR